MKTMQSVSRLRRSRSSITNEAFILKIGQPMKKYQQQANQDLGCRPASPTPGFKDELAEPRFQGNRATLAMIFIIMFSITPLYALTIDIETIDRFHYLIGNARAHPKSLFYSSDEGYIYVGGVVSLDIIPPSEINSRWWIGKFTSDLDSIIWQYAYGIEDYQFRGYKVGYNGQEAVLYGDMRPYGRGDLQIGSVLYFNQNGDSADFIEVGEHQSIFNTGTLLSDGGILMALTQSGQTHLLIKSSINHDVVWSSEIHTGLSNNAISCICELNDSNLIIGGRYDYRRDQNVNASCGLLMKCNSVGQEIWRTTLIDSIPLPNRPGQFQLPSIASFSNVIECSDRSLLAVGYINYTNGGNRMWVAKFSEDGNIQWWKYYNENLSLSYIHRIYAIDSTKFMIFGYIRSDTEGVYVAIIDSIGDVLKDTLFQENDIYEDIIQYNENSFLYVNSNFDFKRIQILHNNFIELPCPPIPTLLSLSAYPNPFNSSTTLTFDLETGGVVRLAVVDPLGRRLHDFIPAQAFPRGRHSLPLDAGDLPSGVYMLRLESSSGAVVKPLTLMR